jgi:hypothetical protein
LADLYSFEGKASSAAGLDVEQTKRVRARAAALRSYYGASSIFPDIYRLRADLLDLLPEGERTVAELVDAQEDRLRYAMLSPELVTLPEETKRMAALALARPAILLEEGKPKSARENWAGLLGRHTSDIAAAASATGIIINRNGQRGGTGFIVAPGVMMTTTFVMDIALQLPKEAGSERAPQLCLGQSAKNCGTSLQMGDILYKDEQKGSKLVLVELRNHDPVVNPPLALAETPAPNTVTGRYAYIIGYPEYDARMPSEFVQRLLGPQPGQKCLMPGRVLAFGTGPLSGSGVEPNQVITTDISTSGGTAGGPLIDLLTGKVIGLSYAGVWKGERGKFAYAQPISVSILGVIERYLRGQASSRAGDD